ncbi:hypothetical protein KY362_06830 [Candidatus Woesearchaeota archaeon]|nr:hypothetical protein [Candidatus Woesearchaeota archaeon]
MELMHKHVKEVGIAKLLLMYLFVIIVIVIIETFVSYNIYILEEIPGGVPILRELFSTVAIVVAMFAIVSNVVFFSGRRGKRREFHYYFHMRPLLLFSMTAIIGDIFAWFLVGRTGYFYAVFFTALLTLNIYATGFAIYSVEKYLKKGL